MQPDSILRRRNIPQPLERGNKEADQVARPKGKFRGSAGVCLKMWVLIGLGAVTLWQFLANAPVAHAHGGVDPGDNLWLAWNTGNPLPSLFLFAAAYLYVNGLGKWDRPSHPVNIWHKISFFSGLLVIFLALQSPIDPWPSTISSSTRSST